MADEVRERRSARLALASLLVLAWLLVRNRLYTSWVPTDEGVIGQGAMRVLHGELPHRDFVALWSGGLDVVHAAVFRVFGVSLAHLRTLLLVSWFGALVATFAVARRLLSIWGAAALTFVIAEWTLGTWWLPMPSWYALFLALAALAVVVRFLETRRAGWLVLAGATVGAACAIKITGVYAIAALLLFFVWLVQEDTPADAVHRGPQRPYAWLVTAGLCVYLALVAWLVVGVGSLNAVLNFLAPSVALAGVLVAREWLRPSEPDAQRFRRLATLTAPFAIGVLAVVAVWIAPYVWTGSLSALARGVFVTPQARFTVAAYPLPGLRSAVVSALPFLALLVGAPFVRRPLRRMDRWALVLVFAALAAVTTDGSPMVLVVWYGFRLLAPCAVVIGAWWLVTADPRIAIAPRRRSLAFLLLAAAATGSLIQVPFALYTYFLYFVPFVFLALAATTVSPRGVPQGMPQGMPREVPAALLVFMLWFGFRQPSSLAAPPTHAAPGAREAPVGAVATPGGSDALAMLALPRGGIMVARQDSALYADLFEAVQARRPGPWMYVWHDAPEVNFLTGTRNPTRTMFEAFDDSIARTPAYVESMLTSHDVRVVVLTPPDGAAAPMTPALRGWIERTYPNHEQVHRFEVRWRGDTVAAISQRN